MSRIEELKEIFESLADSDKAKAMEAYMKNKFPFYGISTPRRREAYKDIIKGAKKSKSIDWEFLDACWNEPKRECHYFVKDYLDKMKVFLEWEDIPKIEIYIRSNQWWDSIDGFDKTIGFIGLTDKRVDSLMIDWSKDKDFWIRRLAIDHQLGRKDKTDTKLLEAILCANFGSREFFINKAIGWALRDYSKTNPAWVRDFLDRYEADMAPLSIREASKYI